MTFSSRSFPVSSGRAACSGCFGRCHPRVCFCFPMLPRTCLAGPFEPLRSLEPRQTPVSPGGALSAPSTAPRGRRPAPTPWPGAASSPPQGWAGNRATPAAPRASPDPGRPAAPNSFLRPSPKYLAFISNLTPKREPLVSPEKSYSPHLPLNLQSANLGVIVKSSTSLILCVQNP